MLLEKKSRTRQTFSELDFNWLVSLLLLLQHSDGSWHPSCRSAGTFAKFFLLSLCVMGKDISCKIVLCQIREDICFHFGIL